MQLLAVAPHGKEYIGKVSQRWESLQKCRRLRATGFRKPIEALRGLSVPPSDYTFRKNTYPIQLLQPWVIWVDRTKPKDHLCCERIGISSNVVKKPHRIVEESQEHRLIFQILVRYIGSGSLDVKTVVN